MGWQHLLPLPMDVLMKLTGQSSLPFLEIHAMNVQGRCQEILDHPRENMYKKKTRKLCKRRFRAI